MCGIAGILDPGGRVDPELLRAMTELLEHRGPDGDGFHIGDGVGLGMRRLAIIDPEGGHQPIYDEQRKIAVVFNGELYNHEELRAWLAERGHEFRSGSDGEVIPHLYEELGPSFPERLNGIFAIALWDDRDRTLHLARDKFGVKPLYWCERDGRVSFASELRSLLTDSAVPRDLDYAAIDQFLTLRFVPSPRTPLASVRKLRPATVLSFGAGKRRELDFSGEPERADRNDRGALVEEYAEAFERAVVRQMMSDRPIGVMLSGGVDSAAVASAMAKNAGKVRAFTVGFAGGADVDEIADARATAERLGAEFESLKVSDADYIAALPGSLAKLEEPVAATSALAVNFVAELMRPSVPVALCGQGADEPSAGYGRYLTIKLAQRLRRVPGARLAGRAGARRVGAGRALGRGLASLGAGDDLDLLMAAYTVLPGSERARLYGPELRERMRGAEPRSAPVERLRARVVDLDPLAQALYVDTRLSLPDELLFIADKMSMAASVELRVPFLDPDLVRVAESARSSERLRGRERKSLHKEAMLRFVPREVVYRRKLGWETPMGRWLRSDLRPLLDEVVLAEGTLCRELFEERELRRLADAHAGGEADNTRLLFSLLSLGLWHQAFVAGGAPAAV